MKVGGLCRRTSTAGPGTSEAVLRDERGALGEVTEDRVGLGEEAPVLGFEHRDPAIRVHLLKELWGARLGPVDVVLDALEGDGELCEEQARLVPVARGQVIVQSDQVFSYVGGLRLTWKSGVMRAC